MVLLSSVLSENTGNFSSIILTNGFSLLSQVAFKSDQGFFSLNQGTTNREKVSIKH